jgi:hypothetical protein
VASFNPLDLLGNLTSLLPPTTNLSAVIDHASKTVQHIFHALPTAPPPDQAYPWQHALSDYAQILTDFLATRTALENTSLLLAICTFIVLVMSWTSRFGNIGRFSPFTRSPPQGSTRVSDADFSYITADDLRKHQVEGTPIGNSHQRAESPDYGPQRDTDVLILRNKKRDFHVHFPAYSIAKGELTIGQVREHAAKKTGTADVRRVKLLYRGKNLKDDSRSCKQEGLRDGSELLCSIADAQPSNSGSEEEDTEDEFAYLDDNQQTADGETRRRRNRGKKTKKRNKREQQQQTDRDGASGTSTPNLAVPQSQSSTRAPSPKPAPTPSTPMDKLNALRETLGTYMPQIQAFKSSPPTDPAKKEFEHKRLSETILQQVLLKLDAVETEGDADVRLKRKELVKETQQVLQELDAVMH